MTILYDIFILPIELSYKYIYWLCIQHLDAYGLGIFALSCVSALIYTPLYGIVAKAQEKEKEFQSVLEPQLKNIKSTSKGAERQQRISALYKRYGYHPIFAIRSAFGIILQVPFLAGAYAMLSTFQPIQGKSLGPIADLAQPDALLWGINALPLLMTFFSISATITIKDLNKKERIQPLVIALLFLVLLYNAPSALLLFWTINNFFFLLKNIVKNICPVKIRKSQKTSKKSRNIFVTSEFTNKVYTLSAVCLVLIITLFIPTQLYISDPAYFQDSIFGVIRTIIPYISIGAILFILLWSSSSEIFRHILAFSVLIALISALGNIFIFNESYGVLNGFYLTKETLLYSQNNYTVLQKIYYFVLQSIIFGTVITSILYYKPFRKICISSLSVVCITLCSLVVFNIFQARNEFLTTEKNAQGENFLPEYAKTMQGYSKNGINTVVIMMDAFSASHIKNMINDSWFDNFARDFDGFTWYSNTLSTGNITILNLPALYGGAEFTPTAINKDSKTSLTEKYNQAYAVLPRNFSQKGFDVHLISGLERFDRELFAEFTNNRENITVVKQVNRDFVVSETSSKASNAHLLMAVSIFQIVPIYIKKMVYDYGAWLGAGKLDQLDPYMQGQIEFFKYVTQENIHTTASKGTFKFFNSILSHPPFFLAEDSLEMVGVPLASTPELAKGSVFGARKREQYYTVRHMMKMLIAYFNELKKHGIYDNTRIILVSDHCSCHCDYPEPKVAPGQPHALLMVKEARSKGLLQEDTRFMGNLDVVNIALQSIGSSDVSPLTDPRLFTGERILYHHIGSPTFTEHLETQFVFDKYKVKENILDIKNWEKEQ